MTRRNIIIYTIIVWAIGCCLYAYYFVTSIISSPDVTPGYEQDWDFQLLIFFIFRFPLLLVIMIVVIVLEVIATKKGTNDLTRKGM